MKERGIGDREQAMWKRINQAHSDLADINAKQAVIEARMAHIEGAIGRLEDIEGAIKDLHSDIRQGRTVVRVLLWVGGVIGAVTTFAAWAWVELKKMNL